MLVFRWILLLALVAGVLCFALYVATGRRPWRDRGVVVVKWTVVVALAFFAVLILERMAVWI